MPSTTQQPGQFVVLIAGAPGITPSSIKQPRQNIIVASKYNDVLMLIETTQFDLVLLNLTVDCPVAPVPDRLQRVRQPWQSELIARIKAPLGINNKTPLIAVINPAEITPREKQCPIGFDDWLISPVTEERLNEIIDRWQTKASTLNYIQLLMDKTKNNQPLALTLFEKLFEELPSQILGIKDALENKQYDLAKEITHKLNGSVSFCGLTDIQQPANTLESCLLNGNYPSTHQYFLKLQECTLNFIRHQDAILASLREC
ncbi:MAG: Hpt domain-containing protein [Methylobacter sp.]